MKMTKEQEASAAEFKQLMNLPAWKKLEQMAIDQNANSLTQMDSISPENVTIGKVCEERGFRKGIRWVLDQAKIKGEIG